MSYGVSIEMDRRLKELGVQCELHPIEGAGHTPMKFKEDIFRWIEEMIAKTYVPGKLDRKARKEMKNAFWMCK